MPDGVPETCVMLLNVRVFATLSMVYEGVEDAGLVKPRVRSASTVGMYQKVVPAASRYFRHPMIRIPIVVFDGVPATTINGMTYSREAF